LSLWAVFRRPRFLGRFLGLTLIWRVCQVIECHARLSQATHSNQIGHVPTPDPMTPGFSLWVVVGVTGRRRPLGHESVLAFPSTVT
jgi:hypothetical protein